MKCLCPYLLFERGREIISTIRVHPKSWLKPGLISLLLLIAGNVSAQNCEGVTVGAVTAHQGEVQKVCKAAQHATELLKQCGIESSIMLNIMIQDELIHPSGLPVFAFFHSPRNQIEITDFEAFKKLVKPDSAYYKLPMRDLYESLIAHEVTHAITCQVIHDSDCPRVAHEYIAAVIQMASMNDASRQMLLDAFPRSTPVELEMFNEFSFYSAPQWFIANAYRHYNKLENGCEFLQRILNGEIQFLCDFEFE